MYTIEELEKTFRIHAIRSEELNKKLIKEFKENNPGQPIPDPFNDNFSLPIALASMCAEIIKLKNVP
jgi:hypothetical protein